MMKARIGATSICGSLLLLQFGCTAPQKAYPQLWRENPAFYHGHFGTSGDPGAVMIGEVGPVSTTYGPAASVYPQPLGGYPPGVRYFSPSGRDLPSVVKTPPRERPPEDLPEGEDFNAEVQKPLLQPTMDELPQALPGGINNGGKANEKNKKFYEDLFEPQDKGSDATDARPEDFGFESWDIEGLDMSGVLKNSTPTQSPSTFRVGPMLRQLPELKMPSDPSGTPPVPKSEANPAPKSEGNLEKETSSEKQSQ